MKNDISINALKFDNKIHKSWNAQIIERKDDLLIAAGKFENDVEHSKLGFIRRGTLSYEFFWFKRWYNIFRFHEPDGNLRNFYCNVNLPPKFENSILSYVDLDIDVLVWKDFRVEVIDTDEFEENSRLFSYPNEVIESAYAAVAEIQNLIKNRIFPFDYLEI